MNDSPLVSLFKCLGNLLGDWPCLFGCERARGDSIREGGSFNQFEDERRDRVNFLKPVGS